MLGRVASGRALSTIAAKVRAIRTYTSGGSPRTNITAVSVRSTGVVATSPGTGSLKCEPLRLLRVGSVRELAELARDEVGRLLADVDGVVADPLQAARDEQHPEPPLAGRLV